MNKENTQSGFAVKLMNPAFASLDILFKSLDKNLSAIARSSVSSDPGTQLTFIVDTQQREYFPQFECSWNIWNSRPDLNAVMCSKRPPKKFHRDRFAVNQLLHCFAIRSLSPSQSVIWYWMRSTYRVFSCTILLMLLITRRVFANDVHCKLKTAWMLLLAEVSFIKTYPKSKIGGNMRPSSPWTGAQLCPIIFLYWKAVEQKRNIIPMIETSNTSKQITALSKWVCHYFKREEKIFLILDINVSQK